MAGIEQWPEPGQLTGSDDMHGTYVERTVRELQARVAQAEKELAALQAAAAAAPVALPSAAASLAVMAAAYEAATQAEPFLPFPDSVLPALLALRTSHEVLAASQVYLGAVPGGEGTQSSPGTAAGEGTVPSPPPLDEAQARKLLAAEQVRRDDQRALQAALEARVAALRGGQATRRVQTAAERRQAQREALRAQARARDGDTAALLRALKGFLHERLGPMLAAEERGGPVVGSAVDDSVAGGRGRRRSTAAAAAATGKKRPRPEHDSRQRRLDDMWGTRDEADGARDGEEMDDDDDDDNDDNDDNEEEDDDDNLRAEAAAASTEMQELTEQLLNALVEAGGDGGSAYVALVRESAAARFLVRAKVAQFHPRDATRLRLVDFGRELDD